MADSMGDHATRINAYNEQSNMSRRTTAPPAHHGDDRETANPQDDDGAERATTVGHRVPNFSVF